LARIDFSDIYKLKGIVRHKTPKGERYVMSPADLNMRLGDVQGFLQAVRLDSTHYGENAYPLFSMMSNLGFRISEMISLTRESFADLESNIIRIRRGKKGKGKERDSSADFVWVGNKEKEFYRTSLRKLPNRERLFDFTPRTAQYLFGFYLRQGGVRLVFSTHALRRFVGYRIQSLRYGEALVRIRLGHNLRAEDHYMRNPDFVIKAMDELEVMR